MLARNRLDLRLLMMNNVTEKHEVRGDHKAWAIQWKVVLNVMADNNALHTKLPTARISITLSFAADW